MRPCVPISSPRLALAPPAPTTSVIVAPVFSHGKVFSPKIYQRASLGTYDVIPSNYPSRCRSILREGSDPFRCFILWSPCFCLCPFDKVPSGHVVLFSHCNASQCITMASSVSRSPQNISLQGRMCQRSHVPHVRAGELDITNPALSPELELGSGRLVVDPNGRNTITRARKTEGCRSRSASPAGPSTAPRDGVQHRLLSGFPRVIASQAPMKGTQ